MRAPRIYVDLPLTQNADLTLPAAPSRYLTKVLRLGADARLFLFNGEGVDYPGRILTTGKHGARVQIGVPTESELSPRLSIHLGVGILKGERMSFLIQKSVELGATRISPLFTRRSVVRLDEGRLRGREEHWRGILIAACEQSGRRRLPELSHTAALQSWLTQDHPCPLLLEPDSAVPLPGIPDPRGALTLLVGPEGGFSPEERSLAEQAGFKPVSLGPRILRAETAPLAALAAIQALWGDFR